MNNDDTWLLGVIVKGIRKDAEILEAIMTYRIDLPVIKAIVEFIKNSAETMLEIIYGSDADEHQDGGD